MNKVATFSQPTPMLNVKDIDKTIEWYQSIGFTLVETNQKFTPEEPVNWAYLERDGAALMFNLNPACETGSQSVTLYIKTDSVDAVYEEIKSKVKVIDEIKNQFYGMRDFYFEDLNGFKFGVGQSLETVN